MKETYCKSPLTYHEQIQQLVERGMRVSDTAHAIQSLNVISYYRLSGYWHFFRQRNEEGELLDSFQSGTCFEEIVRLYEFDRNLRLLVMDAIERIEIAVRTRLTYSFSHQYGSFGYLDANNFHPSFAHHEWLEKLCSEARRSKDPFVKHYKDKYDGFPELPIWMVTEIMSFGSLSQFYAGLRNQKKEGVEDKIVVSRSFETHHVRFERWLHSLTIVRNVCAHHGRLWNRSFTINPGKVRDRNWKPPITPRHDRFFYVLLMCRHLLRSIGWGEQWHLTVSDLLEPIAENRRYRAAMGIPEHWKEHPIWK